MTLDIPEEAIPYILLQRTLYSTWGRRRALSKLVHTLPTSIRYGLIRLESRLRSRSIATAYSADMSREYEVIKPHLPEVAQSVLDIGCGIGGINAFLFNHYQRDPDLNFYLLDKSELDTTLYYGYKGRGAFYNSLEVTRRVLENHDISHARIHTLEATESNEISVPVHLDLVISLISWGYHYPVRTYLERVHELLRPKGRLIMDLRPDTGGIAELRSRFPTVEQIQGGNGGQRVLAIKA